MPRLRALNHVGARGAGLIEVAISLLVLCMGTLGLAGLQLAAKRVGYEALQRSSAAAMASEILERIRVNRSVLSRYQVAALGAAVGAQLPDPLTRCDRASCSPPELAFFDLWQWQRALDGESTSGAAGGLVDAVGCVVLNGRRVTVEISWRDRVQPSAPFIEPECVSPAADGMTAGRQRLRMVSWIAKE